ncbi:MAG: Lrp/AsnC family transcriptional regulator [Hyphomicrobium sp.]
MPRSTETSIADRLLQSYQRDFPLVPQPFAEIATEMGSTERAVRAACDALIGGGVVARIGGVVRPNTIAASTLAAVAVPDLATNSVAEMISALDGVNHVYLRENPINLWFVATGPDRNFVEATLKEVERLSGQPVLDLRLEHSFHIDLGFPLKGGPKTHNPLTNPVVAYRSEPCDRHLVQILTSGLAIHPRPFELIGAQFRISEGAVIARLKHLVQSGVVTRIGAIIRHRALGWRSNAMVVWDVDPSEMEGKARILARHRGINLCYRRKRHADRWPYNLYCMIHAKSRESALRTLEQASRRAGLDGNPREVLFSSRCYKQTGALIVSSKEAA